MPKMMRLLLVSLCLSYSWKAGRSVSENDMHQLDVRLQPTTSGLFYSSNRGYPRTWEQVSDMLVSWTRQESSISSTLPPTGGLTRAKAFEAKINVSAWSYIDSWRGARLALDKDERKRFKHIYHVIKREFTDAICDKWRLAELADQYGVTGDIVPRTYFSKQAALKGLDSNPEVEILFVKDPLGTYGSGITVVSRDDLPETVVPPHNIIQEGFTKNLALSDGKKVTLRVYMVIMHGSIYCHHSGWVCEQDLPFDPSSTDNKVQVTPSGYTALRLDMRVPNRNPDFLKSFDYDELFGPEFNQTFDIGSVTNATLWMDSFIELAKKAGPLLSTVVEQTHIDPFQFSFLGVDLIPLKDGSLKMLEINSYPSFMRSDIMADVILRAFGMEIYDADLKNRLVKAWEFPREQKSEL